MTQEEKAKAYDEALERARKLYNSEETSADVEIACETIFPELAESEDERIRKKLIEFFKDWGKRLSHCWGLSIPDILAWLENQGQVKESPILQQENKTCCKNGNSLTCKNDTILDLLNKMPSCITVDGLDYHFVMKKTSIYLAYYACYNGNGEEGRGNAIFGITAFSPIDLLNEMLEILKEKGLLE